VLAARIFESKNTLGVNDAICALTQLVREARAIFGNAAKRLVATCLQRAQHPIEQLEVLGRPPDGFRFNRRLVEIKSSKYFRNLPLNSCKRWRVSVAAAARVTA
jgi:hypothetical protein